VDKTDIAWAAGFFDGEGCITTPGNSVTISVSQKVREPLDKFISIFKIGEVRLYHHKYRGADYGIYTIHLSGENALGILQLMLPYLTVKKEKAWDAISNREYLYNRDLKRLRTIALLHSKGYSFAMIGRMLNVSRQRIHQLYSNKKYSFLLKKLIFAAPINS